MEKIRLLEYEKNSAPMPVRFDISECLSGGKNKKMIKLWSSTTGDKALHFDIDLDNKSLEKRCFETKYEKFHRGVAA